MIPWQLAYPFMWVVVRHEDILNRLPERAKRWVAIRALRETMASWGLSVAGFADADVIAACRTMAASTSVRDRASAVALHNLLRDLDSEPSA